MRAIITNAGYAALVNAQHDGTNKVTVEKVAVGTGTTAADKTDTALENEVKRIDTIAGEAASDNVIHVTVQDESDDHYTVKEFGLMLDDGTLFARYAQSDKIIEKAIDSTLLLSIDCEFTDVDATQITFGDISFSNPPWSTTTQGVVQMATEAEAKAGTNKKHGMTAKLVWAAIKSFFNGATGAGHGKGLDADMLDGHHSSKTGGLTAQFSAKADQADNADKLQNHAASYFAKVGGDSGQRFNVKDPTSAHHAVSKGWFEDQLGEGDHSKLMGDGAHGLGSKTPPHMVDFDAPPKETGFYYTHTDALNKPPGAYGYGSAIVVSRTASASEYSTLYFPTGGKNEVYFRGSVGSDWVILSSSGNLKNGTGNSKTYAMSQKGATDAVNAHANKTNNPHNVTKSQVGLGNVRNVKQLGKSEKAADSSKFDGHAVGYFVKSSQIGEGDSNNLMGRSAYGLGAAGNERVYGTTKLNTIRHTEFGGHAQGSRPPDAPISSAGAVATFTSTSNRLSQLWFERDGYRAFIRYIGLSSTNNWAEFYTTKNLFTTVHNPSRSANTKYTNTHGVPMLITVLTYKETWIGKGSKSYKITEEKDGDQQTGTGIVPPGWWYNVVDGGYITECY